MKGDMSVYHASRFWIKCEMCYYVTPDFKIKSICSSYVCPRSSCHTYGQNVNTENQYLYYINFITRILPSQIRLCRLSRQAAVEYTNPTCNRLEVTQASRGNLHHKTPYCLQLLGSVTTRVSRLMVTTQQVNG
jgi:hypothetical protein